MTEHRALYVGFANGTYASEQELSNAVPNTENLAQVLATKHGFETHVCSNIDKYDLPKEVDRLLEQDSLRGDALVMSWVGHARSGAIDLELLGSRGDRDDVVAMGGDLGRWAARTGASQVYIIVDTCYSGGALVEAARMVRAVMDGRADPGKTWFGIVAASQGDEPARSGVLIGLVRELLEHGPRERNGRWLPSRSYLTGLDLTSAIYDAWDEPRHTPNTNNGGGFARRMFGNPLYVDIAADEPLPHLLQAARGGSQANFFTGRAAELESIVAWMKQKVSGACVITGPPGSGKSAVLGRIVSLSSAAERARIDNTSLSSEWDPGRGSIDAQIQTRGVTMQTAVRELGRQLGLGPNASLYDVLARAEQKQSEPLVIAIDGLDEAAAVATELATELIQPLARHAQVLIATRDRGPDVTAGQSLTASLGPVALMIDLGDKGRGDVYEYVVARLSGIDAAMDPTLVAERLLADSADDVPFLLARLVTSQLRASPLDTRNPDWPVALARTVESALENDLDNATVTVDGVPSRTAARELLRALAFSKGAGFPAEDVWLAVATALSEHGITYGADQVFELLGSMGRHIVAGYEGDQAVYRVTHQRLVDQLVGAHDGLLGSAFGMEPGTAERIAEAIWDSYDDVFEAGFEPQQHPYLWRYAWLHFADAGVAGIDYLERLDRHHEAFKADLALGLETVGARLWLTGESAHGGEVLKRAVEVRKEIGEPAALANSLIQLSFSMSGQPDAMAPIVAEAVAVARNMQSSDEATLHLARALVAAATARVRMGQDARDVIDNVLSLLESSPEIREKGWVTHGAALVLAAESAGGLALAGMHGPDLDTGIARAKTAVEIIDNRAEEAEGQRFLLIEALCAQASCELASAMRASISDKMPPTPGTDRVLAMLEQDGPTGTITDLVLGRTLLLKAVVQNRIAGAVHPDSLALVERTVGIMRPLVDKDPTAAVLGATAHFQLAAMEADQQQAQVLQSQAIALLEPFSESSPIAAAELGRLLATIVQPRVQQFLQTSSLADKSKDELAYAESLIDEQLRAVALLRHAVNSIHVQQLTVALTLLIELYRLTDQADLSMAARGEVIAVIRNRMPAGENRDFMLSFQLSDFSASILSTRPLESLAASEEAIELGSVLLAGPKAELGTRVIAMSSTNKSAALISLGRDEEARAPAVTAIRTLEPLRDDPIFGPTLATAYSNMARIEINAGNYTDGLELARRAIEVFDLPSGIQNLKISKGIAIVNLADAMRRTGDLEGGNAMIEDLIARAVEPPIDAFFLTVTGNLLGADVWESIIERVASDPEMVLQLELNRQRPEDEIDNTIATIQRALTEFPSKLHRSVREVARQHRARALEAFDAAWQRVAGPCPDWLSADQSLTHTLVAWINTPTWRRSRDFLEANPQLLHPDCETLIREFELDEEEGDKALVSAHLELFEKARARNVRDAFELPIAREDLRAWQNSDSWRKHLGDHPGLQRPAVREVLQVLIENSPSFADELTYRGLDALLKLARRGETQLAFDLLDAPLQSGPHIESALANGDLDRLGAFGSIVCISAPADEPLRLRGIGVMALADAMGDRLERALRYVGAVREIADERTKAQIQRLFVDAFSVQPAGAAAVGQLIAGLQQPADDDSSNSGE